MQYITNSEKETKKLAEKIAKKYQSKRSVLVIGLTGELGSGKTTFVQGFAKGLGINEKIISPTFVLIRQHKIPKTKKMLYHIDLYRIDDEEQMKDIGIKDLLNDKQPAFGRTNHFILIEWAEKAKEFLPQRTTFINFEILDNHKRRITINKNMSI